MEGGVHHVSVSEHLLYPGRIFPAAVLEQLTELPMEFIYLFTTRLTPKPEKPRKPLDFLDETD